MADKQSGITTKTADNSNKSGGKRLWNKPSLLHLDGNSTEGKPKPRAIPPTESTPYAPS